MKTGYNHKRKKEKTKHSAPFINSEGNQHQIKKIYILQAQRKDIDSSSQYHQKKKKKKICFRRTRKKRKLYHKDVRNC